LIALAGLSSQQWLRDRTSGPIDLMKLDSDDLSYVNSIHRLLYYLDGDVTGIVKSRNAKKPVTEKEGVWESNFYIAGVPCIEPELNVTQDATTYGCTIVSDEGFDRAKTKYDHLCKLTAAAL